MFQNVIRICIGFGLFSAHKCVILLPLVVVVHLLDDNLSTRDDSKWEYDDGMGVQANNISMQQNNMGQGEKL